MSKSRETEQLFPAFIKPDNFQVMVIGAGEKGYEKLSALLLNSPYIKIRVLAKKIEPKLMRIIEDMPNVTYVKKEYEPSDLENIDVVFMAIKDKTLIKEILEEGRRRKILFNIDSMPELSDFFLKPAKLLRNQDELEYKVRLLGGIPQDAIEEVDEDGFPVFVDTTSEKNLERFARISRAATLIKKNYLYIIGIATLVVFFVGVMYSLGVFGEIVPLLQQDNYLFFWMLLVGFLAEIIAGSMGMGYGVICTTILLMLNVSPPVISASIHSAETFTTAAGSLSHFRLGNVNKKLVKALALPAVIGAILGAICITYLGEKYATYAKFIIAAYTIYLGVDILMNAFIKQRKRRIKRNIARNIASLGFFGGFIDSFAGGGWGPFVTGIFIKNGRNPRFVVGSSTVAKFFLTLTSALTFVFTIGLSHWNIVLGLLIGGVITAPISARLTRVIPVKTMFVMVGFLVVIMGLISIYKAILAF